MKIAITGIKGFIGTHLKNKLLADGNSVIGIQRKILYDSKKLNQFFEKEHPETIYHLAAYGNHYNQVNDIDCINANIIALNNLLENCDLHRIIPFYNISTSSVNNKYTTFYSATKMAGELLCQAFKNKYNIPILNIRPYSIFGPGEAYFRLIPTIVSCLLNNTDMVLHENATHDWVFVEDFINCLTTPFNLVWENGHADIGTNIKTKNIEIVHILEEISGRELKYIPSTDKLRKYDNHDWVCETKCNYKFTSLYESLKKTYEYYAKQGFKK
jgi:UDP-glucuronate 4-epimerase